MTSALCHNDIKNVLILHKPLFNRLSKRSLVTIGVVFSYFFSWNVPLIRNKIGKICWIKELYHYASKFVYIMYPSRRVKMSFSWKVVLNPTWSRGDPSIYLSIFLNSFPFRRVVQLPVLCLSFLFIFSLSFISTFLFSSKTDKTTRQSP